MSQRVCSMSHLHTTGHTSYLFHSECADGGSIDLQDPIPGVDGVAVVGTDVHPVDPGPDKS